MPSGVDIAARERAQKLVASEADNNVVRSQLGSQRQRHVAEQLVAGCVALNIVDGLEAVDIDEREHELPVRAACPVNLPLESGQATATSERSGQDIDACLVAVAGSLVAVARCAFAGQGCQLVMADRALRGRAGTFLGRAVAFLGRAVALRGTLPVLCGPFTITRTLTSVAGCLLVPADRAFRGRAVPFCGGAVAFLGLSAVLRGPLTITGTLTPVASCLLVFADRPFRRLAVALLPRVVAFGGRAVAFGGRTVALSRSTASTLRGGATLVDRTVVSVDGQAFVRRAPFNSPGPEESADT